MTIAPMSGRLDSLHDRARAERRAAILSWAERMGSERDAWIRRSGSFYSEDRRFMQFLVPPGSRVLEVGCGTGQLLGDLRPSRGVGIDLSPAMLDVAAAAFPNLEFVLADIEDASTLDAVEGPFDVIVLSDVIGFLDDFQTALRNLHRFCHGDTRIVIAYFSQAWRPLLDLGERVGRKMPQPAQNWLAPADIANLLELEGFESIRKEWRQIVPFRLGGLGPIINRSVGVLPGFRRLSLRQYVVARPHPASGGSRPSVSVIIPCRNEAGNIERAIQRLPKFCDDIEVIFVEGHSDDGTVAEIQRVIDAYPDWRIRMLQQQGRGKGDAVRLGFSAATGEILMILDADLTVAPEDLPKFYEIVASGKGEYVHGTRLVYPLGSGAMRTLNLVANHAFARIFSWLLNQRITDTLCGTKVLSARHYQAIADGRAHFGDFDPFGDFDLIFGAAKLNLKLVEMPVRYTDRVYGTTQISRFRDGLLLLRMVRVAFRKLKAV